MPRRIVVVDAEPVVRAVITKTLEREGFFVTATGDVKEAVQMMTVSPPDLVLTNVSLPGISGHEAMQLFKDSCPGIPVLMVPGLPDSEVIHEWSREEGFDIFPKPFLPHALVQKIKEMLDNSSPEVETQP